MYIVILTCETYKYNIIEYWEDLFDDEVRVFGAASYHACEEWIKNNA